MLPFERLKFPEHRLKYFIEMTEVSCVTDFSLDILYIYYHCWMLINLSDLGETLLIEIQLMVRLAFSMQRSSGLSIYLLSIPNLHVCLELSVSRMIVVIRGEYNQNQECVVS